jgi:hypothetical protein
MTLATPPACHAAALAGSFAAVPDSEGAGNIVYRLRLTNTSSQACVLIGIPRLTLLDAKGKPLPTNIRADVAGSDALTAHLTLPPHKSVTADARFSPDVPGPGEQTTGRCEPVAAELRVTAPGGGNLVARISPPTSVCEHGQLSFRTLTR